MWADEEENYVARRLRLDTVPPDDVLLKQIIAELVLARVGLNLQNPHSNEFQLGIEYRREALRRLEELASGAVDESLGGTPAGAPDAVYAPEPLFSEDDFLGYI